MLIFAIYGLIRYQWTRFKVFTIFCIIFFLVLSFGKNFISFYTLFYDYLPFFSKFRNPAYLLIIIQFCTMVLSGMGLTMILKDIKDRKIVLPVYSFCTIILLCLLPMIVDFGNSDGDKLIYNKDRQRNFSILESTRLYEISQIEEREKRFLNDIESQRTKFIRSNPMATFQDLQSLNDEAEQLKANLRGEKESFIANLDTQINDAKNQAESFYKNRLNLSESLVESDIRVMQIFVFLAFSLIVLVYCVQPFLSDFKYSNQILISFIALLVFFDFYLVDRRITNPEKSEYLWSEDTRLKYDKLYSSSDGNTIEPLIKAKAETDLFKDQDGLKNLIKSKQKGEIFRIIDTRGGGFSHSNYWAQHHIEDINGYHPAKLKSYNDFIGRVRGRGFSPYILEMLNVRYILNDDKIDTIASERVYFVNKVMIDYEKNIDKRYEDLYYKKDPYLAYPSVSDGVYITSGSLEADWENSNSKENTLEYNFKVIEGEDIINSIDNSNPNELILEVSTTGPQFLAISEVFYPNGWKATINGQETAIYEVNDLIRGVSIEGKGRHTIRMWFDPADLKWGRVLSYVGFLIIFVFILFSHIQKAITIICKSKTS